MKFVIHDFAFESNSQYLDVHVSIEGFMSFKITDSERFDFTPKEWEFMKKRIDEEFKRLKNNEIHDKRHKRPAKA